MGTFVLIHKQLVPVFLMINWSKMTQGFKPVSESFEPVIISFWTVPSLNYDENYTFLTL
jgi:hypothetical protein